MHGMNTQLARNRAARSLSRGGIVERDERARQPRRTDMPIARVEARQQRHAERLELRVAGFFADATNAAHDPLEDAGHRESSAAIGGEMGPDAMARERVL